MKIIDEVFVSHVLMNYQNYCVGQQAIPSMGNFLEYLLDHNLITENTIRHYVVLNEFQKGQKTKKYITKTEAVNDLANIFGFHPNSIWNILKDHKEKFTSETG